MIVLSIECKNSTEWEYLCLKAIVIMRVIISNINSKRDKNDSNIYWILR